MRKYAYIRISSKDQIVDRQMIKMIEKGVDKDFIFVDKASGKDFDRPNYQFLKKILREGDLVYMDALDRLGRNYDLVIDEWKDITRRIGADIVVLENETLFDSRKFKAMGDHGKLMEDQFLSLLAYVADQERKKIKQRQAEGIAAAKEKGKHLGRPRIDLGTLENTQRKLLEENYLRWKSRQLSGVQFMKMLGLKKNVFYKILREYENNQDIRG
ncbi:recombinase family protein [Geosporobacter ferrireducens]|uniref:recombinase family protein n=1 Tax=Geosporobacter ferrireducens TaxID=1424294 RepID=UPI00139BC820|nr:recombinase family protein [Geosporobacter ferrireducens]MTI53750.1 recombinase family protein [Geosporobacter ferrireducens]